ncbi:MAG: RNA-binding transcriptional accessory protein [Pseudomonadales bacterium]|nr:RNA-binding transcriptional accessory protein [Pseudomonadales bacterium]MCP5215699.1 RNA-binding transcriptional accessory protein [Pseudomonadales bacterium]
MKNITQRIANELQVKEQQVHAAISLLDEGSTVPFISRYRKEVTGGLDDSQLRTLEERLGYLRELENRRDTILKSIEEQGKLTPELSKAIVDADTKTRLEDLYLPYKPKRRTKGQIAIEAGIEPLADALFNNPELDPKIEALAYINTDTAFKDSFKDEKGVLDGAKYILMERFVEQADLLQAIRQRLADEGCIYAKVFEGKENEGAKFRDYFDHSSTIKDIPSHRALALFRGAKEGILQLKLDLPHDEELLHPCEVLIAEHSGIENKNRAADPWLAEVVRWTWRIKLQLSMENDLFSDVRSRAEDAAIDVFAKNLKDLLLAAPAGQRTTIGLDPGIRTGVKVAVVDGTGMYLDSTAIYPHAPKNQWDQSIATLATLTKKYDAKLIAIGNGTASRETDKLCQDLIKRHPELALQKVMVNEAGASVYSASETASKEFPDLDVTIRGAISIARRLQDPLAELVKIEPKSIGVGQYQHDVSQYQLAKNLDSVIEDCVNHVGVEVNSASAALLRRVAGLSQTLADNIVEFRNINGVFKNRESLKKVPRLGEKSFEQAAGFLRIRNGDNPLDASAVHPESYTVVTKMAASSKQEITKLIGNSEVLKQLQPKDFIDDRFGLPTVIDIIKELDKPGRDPRPDFKTANLKEGVEAISDLKPEMILEGTVTNVTNFGAFVDIGVHQDGLVHISALANRFVKDPREVVKAGDIVKVKVVEVDQARKRIALTMRLEDQPETKKPVSASVKRPTQDKSNQKSQQKPQRHKQPTPPVNNAFAAAFAKAQEKNS